MSLEVMSWVLTTADVPSNEPFARLILIGLANHAAPDGTGARPSVATLAQYAGCSPRTVHNKIPILEAAGLIRRGDQQTVAHLRADRRPVVWDLNILGYNDFANLQPDLVHEVEGRANYGVNGVHPVELADSSDSNGVNQVHPVDQPVDNSRHGVNGTAHRSSHDVHQRAHREGSHGVHAGADRTVLKDKYLTTTTKATFSEPDAGHADDGITLQPQTLVPASGDAQQFREGPTDQHRAVIRRIRQSLPKYLSRALSPGPVLVRVKTLLGTGWTPEQIESRFEARSWNNAGPGLVVTTLTGMIDEGPPASVSEADTRPSKTLRCEDHGTRDAAWCGPCWSEVKIGDRSETEVGRKREVGHEPRAKTTRLIPAQALREP